MEKIVGHIMANATSKELDKGKHVVHFTIAETRTVPNGEAGTKNITRFFECSYWVSAAITPYLHKGRLVTLEGVIGARAYINSHTGEAVAVLTLTAQHIQLYGPNKKKEDDTTHGEEPETAPY